MRFKPHKFQKMEYQEKLPKCKRNDTKESRSKEQVPKATTLKKNMKEVDDDGSEIGRKKIEPDNGRGRGVRNPV